MREEGWSYKNFKIGYKPQKLTKYAITKAQLIEYAEASGDYNPLHIDDDYAKHIGFNGVIAHGMLVMGFGDSTLWILQDLRL